MTSELFLIRIGTFTATISHLASGLLCPNTRGFRVGLPQRPRCCQIFDSFEQEDASNPPRILLAFTVFVTMTSLITLFATPNHRTSTEHPSDPRRDSPTPYSQVWQARHKRPNEICFSRRISDGRPRFGDSLIRQPQWLSWSQSNAPS